MDVKQIAARRTIAIVAPSLASGGGVERVMPLLADGLAAQGYDVRYVALCEYKNSSHLFDYSAVHPNLKIIEMKARRIRYSIGELKKVLFNLPRNSVVLTTGLDMDLAVFLADPLNRIKKHIISGMHNTFSMENKAWLNPTSLLGRVKKFLKFALVKFLYGRTELMITVSGGACENIKKQGVIDPRKVHFVYNPAVVKNFEKLQNEPLSHPFFANPAIPCFVSVGRLEEQKNFPLLIDAFSRVKKELDSRLVIVGEGSLREELSRQISALELDEFVDLVGFDTNPFRYMKNAAAVVLSSTYEGLPTVLIEAMACGTVVISTDCPSGPSEILENGKYGFLVPIGNAEKLSEAMLNFLKNNLPASMSEEKLKARANEFSLENSVRGYMALIEGV